MSNCRRSAATCGDGAAGGAELARVQYRAGSTDFLVLLDAERTLLAVEDSVARAETLVNTAAVGLYKALSGGWGEERTVAVR